MNKEGKISKVNSELEEKIKIVLVEDEAIVRLDLKEILEEEGFEVVGEAGRGDEVYDLVKETSPDLVILDIKMPGMDGLTAAKSIKDLPSTAILFLTAFSQRDLIEEARDAGAMGYLVKPFQRDEIVPAIEIAIARHQEISMLETELSKVTDEKEKITLRLEMRKSLDRAKGILIDENSLSEGEAFNRIRKYAMDNRLSMKEVSEKVIAGEVVL